MAKIGLGLATVAACNAMIGASIFLNPALLVTTVGPVALLTYVLIIAMIWSMAQAFALVAERYPGEGSVYRYGAAWGGAPAGWLMLGAYVGGLTVALALLARITGAYVHAYVPNYSAASLTLVTIVLLTLLNAVGARTTAWSQVVLLVLTLAPIFGIMALCLSKFDYTLLTPFAPFGWARMFKAIPAVAFGFFGFETATALIAQVDRPQTVSQSMTYATGLVGLLYLSFITLIFCSVPPVFFADSTVSIGQALAYLFPQFRWLTTVIDLSIIVTIMGTIHSLIWALGALSGHFVQSAMVTRVAFVGGAVALLSQLLTKVSLFMSLTAMLLGLCYAGSIAALLGDRCYADGREKYIMWLGLASALLISLCGFLGVIPAR